MGDIKIQRVKPSNWDDYLPDILRLSQAMYEESRYFGTTKFDTDHVTNYFKETYYTDGKLFVATVDGAAKGFLMMELTDTFFGPNPIVVERGFYIHPDYRGKHIAPKLLEKIESWAEENDATVEFGVSSGINNHVAEALLVQRGYSKSGTLFEKETPHVR